MTHKSFSDKVDIVIIIYKCIMGWLELWNNSTDLKAASLCQDHDAVYLLMVLRLYSFYILPSLNACLNLSAFHFITQFAQKPIALK